jgi:hypothetical protein
MHFNPKPRGIEGNEKAGSAPAGNPAAESSSSNLGCRALGGGSLPSSRGVALVITLIMLSVITFMAVTFLVLSHRERGSVTTTTDQTSAGFTAETALERAKAEILARIVALTNDQNYDLIVSTNFINYGGFDPGAVDYRTNVNYDYLAGGGGQVTGNNALQNLANLFYNPRPPVFIVTNRQSPNNTDFRYYLDLNRNGRYDTNGFQPEIGINGKTNGTINFYVGDPEWIGVLEHPDQPHSANNKFVARYAYIVLPAGKTLDVNYAHNDAALGQVNNGLSFRRNMGVGTWEINLAAFLADLNTNQWDPNPASTAYYQYLPLQTPNGVANGQAFEDADAFLNYRYGPGNPPWNNLQNLNQIFPAVSILENDLIDDFGAGAAGPTYLTGTQLPALDGDLQPLRITSGWPGANNTNHYFTPQDFFDPTKTSGGPLPAQYGFTNRMLIAGAQADSYDRYTFYRMLAQLGTDSTPEQNKINLNYKNVDSSGNVVPGMETNLIPWPPLQLFTNAAQKIFAQLNLRDGYNNLITVTNIPLYPTNYYTPAVHRVLQLAANMFEATSTNLYPCSYRPYFSQSIVGTNNNIVISGYDLVNGADTLPTYTNNLTIPIDLYDATNRASISGVNPIHMNVYGAPWLIGARKGFPNLNEIVMQSVSQITRKLQVRRPNTTTTDFSQFHTTQLIMAGISNTIGVEVWNSYATNYPRQVYIYADGNLSMTLTNDFGYSRSLSYLFGGAITGATNVPALNWQGTGWQPGIAAQANPQSFIVPLLTNVVFLPDSAYQVNPLPGFFAPIPTNSVQNWSSINYPPDSFPQPLWGLTITNRIRCMIIDGGFAGRVIDYVQLNGLNSYRNLAGEIYPLVGNTTNTWSTNYPVSSILGIMPEGVNNQITISEGMPDVGDAVWANNMMSAPIGPTRQWAIDYFRAFLGLQPIWNPGLQNTQLVMQVPFTPTAKNYQLLAWEANDPLVHYTAGDLTYPGVTNVNSVMPPNASFTAASSNFWRYTDRYDPWGGNPAKGPVGDKFAYLTALKDPLVRASDDWDFPTNKFPNVGWLGRMHRGTPWQTVYLKSATNPIAMWTNWSGDMVNWIIGGTNYADASFSHPINDRQLFDLFTTAVDDNATRGQLSVNQANLAAWSAVLSGVIVLTNSSPTVISNLLINPAGVYNPAQPPPPIVQIVQGINNTRTNFLNNSFSHLGDILATPQLTEQSPFLNINNMQTLQAGGLSDEVMERIPQQILGLLNLSHTPRFVIYSYGQTLHPADHSIITYGTYFGLCTNYQVTAESATRTVVRVEGAPTNPHVVVEQFNVLPPD